jgi:hypothetical protein
MILVEDADTEPKAKARNVGQKLRGILLFLSKSVTTRSKGGTARISRQGQLYIAGHQKATSRGLKPKRGGTGIERPAS